MAIRKIVLLLIFFVAPYAESMAMEGSRGELSGEYPGPEYRLLKTAMTGNPLDGPGTFDDADESKRQLLHDNQPKRGADDLRDYKPELAKAIDDLPDVSLDNLADLLSQLDRLNLEVSKMPGVWVDGNLALGAKPREYVPSDAEIMAAALGNRISAFLYVTKRDVMNKHWSAIRDRPLQYMSLAIRHVDVMGSGRFFYSSAPIVVNLPEGNDL